MTDWPGTEEKTWPGTEEQAWPGTEEKLQPNTGFFNMPESDRQMSRLVPNVNRIMNRFSTFGEAFMEGLQPESLGISGPSQKWLEDNKILPKDSSDFSNPLFPFAAFNEGIVRPLAVGIDTLLRSPMALYRGAQSLGMAGGVHRDIVSIPDAFMGSPHPLGIPPVRLEPPKPFVKPVDIQPIKVNFPRSGYKEFDHNIPRTEAAKTGDPLIDQILDHPTMKAVIENPVVDDSHTIPNSLGGSTPMENPTLYRDKDFPKTMTVDGEPQLPPVPDGYMRFYHGGDNPTSGGGRWVAEDLTYAKDYRPGESVHYVDIPQAWLDQKFRDTEMYSPTHPDRAFYPRRSYPNFEAPEQFAKQMKPVEFNSVTFDTAEPSAIHENVEEFVIDALTKTGMDQATALKVAFWNFGEVAEDAWYRSHGMDPEKVEAKYTEHLDRIAARKPVQEIPETIVAAATRFRGKVYRGNVHFQSLEAAAADHGMDVSQFIDVVNKEAGKTEATHDLDGFLTSNGRFVSREEARDIADKADQLTSLAKKEKKPLLSMEELSVEERPGFGKPSQKGVPPDLFRGTYPDGDPAKAAPGPIDKPTPEESARGQRLLEKYLAGEGNPSGIVAYHGTTAKFEKFDASKIGTGEGSQAYGYGLYFAEHPDVASSYAREPFSSKAAKDAQLYQVSIKVNPDHFLDWDKPLSDQHPNVQEAIKSLERLSPSDSETGQEVYAGIDAKLAMEKRKAGLSAAPNDKEVAEKLRAAGIPGIKYLDQGSRVDKPIENASIQYDPVDKKYRIRDEWGSVAGETDTLEDAKGIVSGQGVVNKTRNYVVFDDNLVQITHVNGQPILDAARDLGVIGPSKVPLTEGKPAEAAARATGGDGGDVGKPPTGGGGPGAPAEPPQPTGNPWRDRFEHFVGKLETPEDVKQLIRESADEKGEFPAARQGDIPLAQVEAIAEAAGVEPGEVNQRGLGRMLKNDNEVRTAMQLMLQVTENVKEAARNVRADGSPESLIKLQEAIMRRDLAVEQVVGLRAEWGRTGNVFQEFMRDVKDQEGLSNFLKGKGRTPSDLRDIADAVDALDRSQTARVLNDLRTPTAWDKFMWYYVNALISGLITHGKYAIANGVFQGYETSAVTPVAGLVGTVRRSLLGGNEGVFIGEAPARLWGIVAGTPDAIVAAAKAARTGLQTPLPGEIAQNITPKSKTVFQQTPIGGVAGTLIGLPSRGASAIHSLYNFIGYRASIEAQAYRYAASTEGLSPIAGDFWERRQRVADAPTVEMMNNAIEEGYRGTFINELGPAGQKISAAIKATKAGQVLMPFTHIPFNILSRGIEGAGAGYLTAEGRADLFGKNGAVKQDMAIARMVVGTSVAVWGANLVLNDRMTGAGPTDPKERAQWLATGHQPYSIRVGDEWISYNRFGPIGTMLGLHANLAETMPHLKPDAEELTKALTMTVHATGLLMEDEVGMQTLASLIQAIQDPTREGVRAVSNFAGGFLPYSSFQRQTASGGLPFISVGDPYMRETKSVVDGLRYYIPSSAIGRQSLPPKLDWLGEPITNAGYGGDLPVPGFSGFIQHRQAGGPEIAAEMQRLDLHPAVPQNRVGGVQLPPKLYDQYQMAAGQLTRQVLNNWIAQPNWYQMPEFARAEVFRRSIMAARQQAGAMMMGMYPQIIQQGVQQRVDQINGVQPTKLKD